MRKQFIGSLCVYRESAARETLSAEVQCGSQSFYYYRSPKCFTDLIADGTANIMTIRFEANEDGSNPRNAELALSPERARMFHAVEYLKKYINAYDKQYQYLDYSDETLINDILYGLGVALDEKQYMYADGFRKFKERLHDCLTTVTNKIVVRGDNSWDGGK